MVYDFDKPVDRTGTSSLKWDFYKDKEIIPLWVADMDFPASHEIINALHKRIDHGVLGYTLPPDELYEVLTAALLKEYEWKVAREWIICLPGVVTGLNLACRCVGEEGDEVLVPVPVYPPFFDAPKLSERKIIEIPMIEKKGRLVFDFDLFEEKITPRTRLFLFCTPHNPGGTVFTREELTRIARICNRHGIVICSDEIHCGLLLDRDKSHIPTAALDDETAQNTITLMAPSKTYNIPGLGFSFAVIPDPGLRKKFTNAMKGIVPYVNVLGYTGAIAAYRESSHWRSQVIGYLRQNRDLALEALNKMPGIKAMKPEASYLIWMDTRETGIEKPAQFFEKAGVGLSDGAYFGRPGFLRLNFGCSRHLLQEALNRMAAALD